MSKDKLEKSTFPISAGTQVSGLWFPTGYYGQVMSKNRLDIENAFREQARPTPPHKFENRCSYHLSKTSHPFSSHDNRNLFQRDGCYFGKDKNVGKKFITGRSHSANGNILLWRDSMKEIRVFKDPNLLNNDFKIDLNCRHIINPTANTSYQSSFCRNNSNTCQKYVPPQHLADIPIMESTYYRSYKGEGTFPRLSRYNTQ